MAESIAKLAVIITGDAAPLARETARAEHIVKRFAGSQDQATQSTLRMGQALSASRGNLAAIWNLPGAGPATVFAASAAAAAGMAINIARAADAIQVDLVKAVDEWRKKKEELFPSGGGPKLSFDLDPNGTWTSSQAKLTEEMGKSGGTLAVVFRDLTDGASMAMQAAREYRRELGLINSGFLLLSPPEQADKISKQREELNVQMAILKNEEERRKIAAERAKEEEKARESGRKRLEEMAREARSFMDSLRTPWEVLVDKVIQLQGLLASGAIGQGRFDTSFDRLFSKFREDNADKTRLQASRGVGAAERFTTAGQSAVESGKRELEKIEKVNQQQLEEARKATQQRRDLIEAVKNRPQTILQLGGL